MILAFRGLVAIIHIFVSFIEADVEFMGQVGEC